MTSAPRFRLFACCIPVRGARRSTICDLQRHTYRLIPNALYEILTEHRDKTLDEIKDLYGNEHGSTIEEYFDFLLENELGFWCSEPERFPDLDLTWETPNLITNAIIDVDASSNHDFPSLFSQLDDLGCSFLQLRFYCEVELPALQRDILVNLRRGRSRSVELILKHHPDISDPALDDLCVEQPRVTAIFVHSAPLDRSVLLPRSSVWTCCRRQVIGSAACCGEVHPGYFSPTYECFLEAQRFNTCLNRKVSVDARGEIKNCPSMTVTYGNCRDTSLAAAIARRDFRRLWEINKDQIDVCRDCEFRYICVDCRAFIRDDSDRFSKPSKCTYDPYTAEWLNEGQVATPYAGPPGG
jgi:SPASM domain peptide maturase of grasp-with-spasm system